MRDALRHRPGRIEIHFDDLRRHRRRRARRLADDHIAGEREIAAIDRLQGEGRHVDEHVARRLVELEHRLDAGKIGLELLQPLLRRDIEGGVGARIEKAADAEAVADLEAGKPILKLAVEHRAHPAVTGKIAGQRKLASRGNDLGPGVAQPKRRVPRHRRPAAGSYDLPIALDALLQRRDRGFADEGHAHGIAGTEPVVELGARLIAPRLLLGRERRNIAVIERIERIEDAGDRRRRRQSAKQHCRGGNCR